MDISVIIPAYGRQEVLVRCLRSLGNDAAGPSWEACVVDDGSGLDEDAVRRDVRPSFMLRWTAFETPKGRSAARNAGVQSSRGRIVVFLDADMEVEQGFLEAHFSFHLEHPRTAAVGTIVWPARGAFERYIGSRGAAKLRPADPVPPWYFVTGNASLEREDLPGDAPFDETLTGWGGEDLDLGMRLARSGIGFAVVRSAVSRHLFDGALAEHLSRTRAYGANALPALTARYPELAAVTRLDRLKSPVYRLLTGALPVHTVAFLAGALDPLPLPDIVFDYLTFSAYARGFLERTP